MSVGPGIPHVTSNPISDETEIQDRANTFAFGVGVDTKVIWYAECYVCARVRSTRLNRLDLFVDRLLLQIKLRSCQLDFFVRRILIGHLL